MLSESISRVLFNQHYIGIDDHLSMRPDRSFQCEQHLSKKEPRLAFAKLRHVLGKLWPTGLAPGKVYLHLLSPTNAVSSYLTLFTLTPIARGGIVSVALARAFRPVTFRDYHALGCPDFPPQRAIIRLTQHKSIYHKS